MKTLTTALGVALALALAPSAGAAQSTNAVAEGATLYGQNCMRCHSARSPMERTDREWVTVVNHMRARANLRRSEARALIAFLQSTNVPEAGASTGVPAAPAAEAEPAPAAQAPPSAPPPPESADASTEPPLLVLVDLADPAMDNATRNVLQAYLEGIRDP